jgi:hypothetical protein
MVFFTVFLNSTTVSMGTWTSKISSSASRFWIRVSIPVFTLFS